MRMVSRFMLLGLLVVALSGCRMKGWESFNTSTTPVEFHPAKGDVYGDGGVADATGGLNPKTRYGLGANIQASQKLNPAYDQAGKGTGNLPGEYPNVAAPGHGQSNGPAFQPDPASVGPNMASQHG